MITQMQTQESLLTRALGEIVVAGSTSIAILSTEVNFARTLSSANGANGRFSSIEETVARPTVRIAVISVGASATKRKATIREFLTATLLNK